VGGIGIGEQGSGMNNDIMKSLGCERLAGWLWML
jgi:hypothetical protein